MCNFASQRSFRYYKVRNFGKEEEFPAIQFVTGGAWKVPTVRGHLLEGSTVKGAFELLVTELEGIEVVYGPPEPNNLPEKWYQELPKRGGKK